MSTVTPVTSESDFRQQISKLSTECLAVIYFHAPWAAPCKQMSVILDTLASTYDSTAKSKIAFFSLDAEDVAEVSEEYDVTQVPLVVLQKDGKVVDSVTGTDASKVRNTVERHAGRPGATTTVTNGLPPAQAVTKPASTATNGAAQSADPSTNATKDDVVMENGTAAPTPEELNARLSELVKAAPVMLFMKGTPSAPQCGFSRQTVGLLRERGVRYGFFNILADDEVRQGLKEFSEWPTFPQLYVDGEFVGGLDIVKEEFENDPEFLKSYSVHSTAVA